MKFNLVLNEKKSGMSKRHVTNVMQDKEFGKHVTSKYREFRGNFNELLYGRYEYNERDRRPFLRSFTAYSGTKRNINNSSRIAIRQHLGDKGFTGSKRFRDKWGPRYALWFFNDKFTPAEKENLVYRAMLRVQGVRRRGR